MIQNKMIGRRYDGGKSPLGGRVDLPEFDPNVLAVDEPGGGVLAHDPQRPYNLAAPGRWSRLAQDDYDRVPSGLPPATGAWMDGKLREWGYDPDRVDRIVGGKRKKLLNKIRREVMRLQEEDRRLLQEQIELEATRATLASNMARGYASPGYVPGGRNESLPMDVKFRGGFPKSIGGGWLPSYLFDKDIGRRERTKLHIELRSWAAGPLKLERSQASSLHHMLDYDRQENEDGKRWRDSFGDSCQIVLVENDWGVAVPQIEGEWRVPFEFICWEFRISGVRVLAFTEADVEPNVMWCVYGRDEHWVVDDFQYELGCAGLPRGIQKVKSDAHEFRRVAAMCYNTIRATCIMLDAQVARHETVAAPPKLAERRAREGRAPLRDHYVVRLLNAEHRAYHRARTAGASASGSRAAQRGHWRKGTWVHFDDPDSGQVQYPNDGGFVVSKTWRRWHFAGNPNDIIHKEYRL